MPVIESILERKTQDGKTFWLAIIEGKEVMAWDSKVLEFKGKECPYPIIKTKSGKEMIAFPKEGGGKKGGYGKSDKEIYAGILTMLFAYSKDEVVPMITSDNTVNWVEETTLRYYRTYSKAVLADLKLLCPDVPVEAVKAPDKPPVVTPQPTSGTKAPATPKAPYDPDTATAKQKLEHEMWRYLQNTHADTDQNFITLLMNITEFPERDKETKKPTGKMRFCDNWDALSEAWAKSSLGKLRELVDEEERKAVASADLGDINF